MKIFAYVLLGLVGLITLTVTTLMLRRIGMVIGGVGEAQVGVAVVGAAGLVGRGLQQL